MGSLFRSEEMTLCQLFLHTDSAYSCIAQLGELGAMEFIDTIPETSAYNRKFVNEVRKCDEMERKLRFLEKEINIESIPILDTGDNPLAPEPREIIELENTLEGIEEELKEVNNNFDQLKRNFCELVELNYLLQKTKVFFERGVESHILQDIDSNFDDKEHVIGDNSNIRSIAGVILREKIPGFERMLWRVCRGNVLIKFNDIEVELEDFLMPQKKVKKSAFVIFFQGEQLNLRVRKICEAFHANVYPCSDNINERKEIMRGVITRMEELKRVLDQTQNHRQEVLVAAARHIRVWFIKIRKTKAIYHILNLFNVNVTDKCMIGECWCPVNDIDSVYASLRLGMDKSNGTIQPILNVLGDNVKKATSPPTFHRVNRFTSAFQDIVDAYGVASYREINPAPYTIITFPFLFAVMFGDCGHGLIMFLFAFLIVWKERYFMKQKSTNEIWNIFFDGRYIILLMGAFSVYTGLIYNDLFSRSINIFGSSWFPGEYNDSTIRSNGHLQLNPNSTLVYRSGSPYPFGMDPVWQMATNKISFTNSIKMKLSIVFGVCQMMFGVSLSLLNHCYNRDYLSVIAEFVPQVLFLTAIFGYLIVEIFIKWVTFGPASSGCAPSLLIGLINMFMFKHEPPAPGCDVLINYQNIIEAILVVIAVICIPWMLLVKPIVLIFKNHQKRKLRSMSLAILDPGHVNNAAELDGNFDDIGRSSTVIKIEGGLDENENEISEVEEFNIGEIFVHQSIHTIEYCLGCISNTASYLRLWALSLAHAQLSEVLWNMVLHMALQINGYLGAVALFFIFGMWATLTVAVLLLMEGLSAFLHALRLHWVEFQNKFYKGEGYKFMPFTFKGVEDLAVDM